MSHFKNLGIRAVNSDSNFILVQLADQIEKELEKRKILIRNTKSFGLPSDYYRITIGKNSENALLIDALKEAKT